MSDALTFLQALWSDKPESTAIQLWRKSDHKTFYYSAVAPAADWVDGNQGCDVYMGAGLAAKEQSPNKKRATKQSVVGIAGVWADIDVNGGPDLKTSVAPTVEEAMSLAEALLQPTLLVNSGYGLQAWWLFETPWVFYTESDRNHAQLVVTGFQGALKAEARKRGYTIDSTFDLARLMRVPGSMNHKGAGVNVCLLDDGGPLHQIDEVERVGGDHQSTQSTAGQLISGAAIEIEIHDGAQPPMMKLEQLVEAFPEFGHVWNHQITDKRKQKSWSMSEWEFSITNHLVEAGWTDQEICDTLVYHRLKHEPTDPKGKNRVDRLAATIGKVRATRNYESESEAAEANREQAATELAAMHGDGGLNPIQTLSLFNRVLGGPEIKEFIQTGRDPDTSRYLMVLANGDQIPIGPAAALINQDRFNERFMVVTKFLPYKLVAKKWRDVVQALLDACHVREDTEDTRSHRAIDWLLDYTEHRLSTDRDIACLVHDPFTSNGHVFIPLGPFHQYLRKIRGERIPDADVRSYLEAAGFERKTINYTKDTGRKSTRSYFTAPVSVLDPPL